MRFKAQSSELDDRFLYVVGTMYRFLVPACGYIELASRLLFIRLVPIAETEVLYGIYYICAAMYHCCVSGPSSNPQPVRAYRHSSPFADLDLSSRSKTLGTYRL